MMDTIALQGKEPFIVKKKKKTSSRLCIFKIKIMHISIHELNDGFCEMKCEAECWDR